MSAHPENTTFKIRLLGHFPASFSELPKMQSVRKKPLFLTLCALTYFYCRNACVCYVFVAQVFSAIWEKKDCVFGGVSSHWKFIATAVAINFQCTCDKFSPRWKSFLPEIPLFPRSPKIKNAFACASRHFCDPGNTKAPLKRKQGLKTHTNQCVIKRAFFLTICFFRGFGNSCKKCNFEYKAQGGFWKQKVQGNCTWMEGRKGAISPWIHLKIEGNFIAFLGYS